MTTWNLTIAGRDKGWVKATINQNDRIPPCVRSAMCAAIDGLSTEGQPFVIDSAGSLDSTGGNVKFTVRTQHTMIEP